MRVLIVDDNATTLKALGYVIEDIGHEAVLETGADKALARCRADYFPMILTDLRMPGMDGLAFLAALKADPAARHADVVICTGHGDMESAIAALREGAYDYLHKPVNARELVAVVERIAEHQALLVENRELTAEMNTRVDSVTKEIQRDLEATKRRLRRASGLPELVAASPSMQRILEEAGRYHESPESPVLIEGETGVGKEVVARLIHFGEEGNDAPFVDINCAAVSPALFESEFFGYEKGAFTGAAPGGASGKLEQAAAGTVLLDEVGDMPPAFQPKLLRVLQERTYYRVGGVRKLECHARFICATNRRLDDLMEQGAFRKDLYHRLRVGHIRIPPLRERPEEIEPLARLFLRREADRKKRAFREIAPDALDLLRGHPWPGNVRELENAIERAVLANDATVLGTEHLAFLAPRLSSLSETVNELPMLDLDHLILPDHGLDLEALNKELVKRALDKFGGNKTQAARYLGMSRGAFRNRLENL